VNAGTDAQGKFVVDRLAPGRYSLRAERDGFVAHETADGNLQAGFESVLPPTLLVACASGHCSENVRNFPKPCASVRSELQRLFAERTIRVGDGEACALIESAAVTAPIGKSPGKTNTSTNSDAAWSLQGEAHGVAGKTWRVFLSEYRNYETEAL
jgi:hypothetical protein